MSGNATHGGTAAPQTRKVGTMARNRGMRWIAATAVLAFAALAVAVPTPASAARIGIYVVAPTWLGNCANSSLGGSVRELHVSNWTPGATTYAHDAGDDIVWIGANSYAYNSIVAQPFCFGWWGRRAGAASSHTIRPTRHGQTFWVGPWGVRSN